MLIMYHCSQTNLHHWEGKSEKEEMKREREAERYVNDGRKHQEDTLLVIEEL